MIKKAVARSPITDRIRAEQALAWIGKWQLEAPNQVIAALAGKSLTVHALPAGHWMFRLDWHDGLVTVVEAGSIAEPYCFHEVSNALIFLDALLLRHVQVLDDSRSHQNTQARMTISVDHIHMRPAAVQ